MRIWFVLVLFIFCSGGFSVFAFPSNTIEFDLVNKHVRLIEFRLADKLIQGDFIFNIQRENGSLLLAIEGKNITVNGQYFPWAKAHFTKRGNHLLIDTLELPQSVAKGRFDLASEEFLLHVEGDWHEATEFLQGDVFVKTKIWGRVNNLVTSGFLTVEEGIYEGQEFKYLRLDFIGKPPVLNITDSEIVLHDGSIFEYVDAVLDVRDFSNPIIPNPELVSHKVFFGDWQVYGEDKSNIGLRKKLDQKIDVLIKATDVDQERDHDTEAGTELRYNWKNDQFLKLKMEEDRHILGFEQRRDF